MVDFLGGKKSLDFPMGSRTCANTERYRGYWQGSRGMIYEIGGVRAQEAHTW